MYMLELITEAVTALQSETAPYPDNVQLWMKLMGLSFLASLLFVYSKAGARWILARVVKKHMRPPDNNIAEVRLTVLDCELSGHDTDLST